MNPSRRSKLREDLRADAARLGLPLDRCIHTNPIKKPADIDAGYAAGTRTFVVENLCEVEKFAGRPADIERLVKNVIAVVCSSPGSASTSAVTARRRVSPRELSAIRRRRRAEFPSPRGLPATAYAPAVGMAHHDD